jgi:signal transduction histidine kinase
MKMVDETLVRKVNEWVVETATKLFQVRGPEFPEDVEDTEMLREFYEEIVDYCTDLKTDTSKLLDIVGDDSENEELRDITALFDHDLRPSMNALVREAELSELHLDKMGLEKKKESLEKLKAYVYHTKSVGHNILTKLCHGVSVPVDEIYSFGEHNLAEIIYIAKTVIDNDATYGRVPVTIKCPEDLTLRIDKSALYIGVWNLLRNAKKAMEDAGIPEDKKELEVWIDYHATYTVAIRVSDNGNGINPEIVEGIFEGQGEFEMGKRLGLRTTLQTVEAHGGYMAVNARYDGKNYSYSTNDKRIRSSLREINGTEMVIGVPK